MSEQPHPGSTDDLPACDPALDAGLAAAFGPDSGPPIPAASVLKALVAVLPAVPHVHLREPTGEAEAPLHRPGSPEVPAPADPARCPGAPG